MNRTTANERRLRAARRALHGTRSRFVALLTDIAAYRVTPRYRGLRWVSATVLILFAAQLVTGIFLSLYYTPDPASAHESTRVIVGQIPAGWLVRSLHSWAGDLLVAAVLLHLAIVFFRRAYVRPRELQWVIGVFLFLLVIAFRFTGRLLPWDTFGYEWAQGGLVMLQDVPVVGGLTAEWLRGGAEFGTKTLGRFYTTHALILPWLVFFLVVAHVYFMRRHGLKGGTS